MKRLSFIAFSAALLFAAVSCQEKLTPAPAAEAESKADVQLVPMSFDVNISKISLTGDAATGLGVQWKAGDKIAVFDDVDPTTVHEFTAAADGASVMFSGTVSAGSTEFYAVYPYSSTATINGAKISTVIPAEQSAVAGQADPDAVLAVAHTTGTSLDFKQAGALVSVSFEEADSVSSFYIQGMELEKISGAVEITVSDTPSASVSGESRITVTPSDGDIFKGTYYVAVPTVNFTKGFRVVFRSPVKVLSMSRTTDKSLQINRKAVVKLGNLVKGHKWNAIENKEQMITFLDKASGIGAAFVAGDVVELLEDISLGEGDAHKDGLDATFYAIFEGNNHTINVEYQGAPSQNTLFKSTNGATIQNLYLTGNRHSLNRDTKDQIMASIVGRPENTTIINCHSSVNITHTFNKDAAKEDGNALIGGLLGYVTGSVTVRNCSYSGNMSFNSGTAGYGCIMGGVIGFTKAYSAGAKRIIDNCTVTGDVTLNQNITSKWCMYAGFAAQPKLTTVLYTSKDQADLLSITNCTSSVNVTVKGATKTRVGGFIANPFGAYYLENDKFDGSVSYESTNSGGEHLAGGMFAYSETSASGYIKSCTFDGSISNEGGATTVKYWFGGIAGTGMNAATVIDGCTVTSKASVKRTLGVDGSGGLVAGRPNTAIAVKNCKVAGYINDKTGGEVTINSQSVLDANQWVLKGSNTTAAVVLTDNVYSSGE